MFIPKTEKIEDRNIKKLIRIERGNKNDHNTQKNGERIK